MENTKDELVINQLQQQYANDPRRIWTVKRVTEHFDEQDFNILFFREVFSAYHEDDGEKHQLQTLIPLNQYLAYIGIDLLHSENLIKDFLYDNLQALNIMYKPNYYTTIVTDKPDKAKFFGEEFGYESFMFSDIVPIYIINKHNELTMSNINESVNGEFYVTLQHTDFIETVFRSYSMFVKSGEFAKVGFLDIWSKYLNLMQENALSKNLEEIHRTFWLSQCPELEYLKQFTNSIN